MIDRLPKRKNTGEPLRKFLLLAGTHCDAGGVKKRGEVVESEQDLVALHGREKFRPMFRYGDDEDHSNPPTYETEAGIETADEIAARVRAQVLSEMNLPLRQCPLFGDCLLPAGHSGPCGFARPEIEAVKGKPAPFAPLEPIQPKPANKVPTATANKVQPKTNTISNASEAPKTQPARVKSPTSQFDAYTEEELRGLAADEEVDVTNCKTKEDLIKSLVSANTKV